MLDFGWSEFFLIIILAIVLMGPKDIPDVIHGFGRLVRRVQYMKFALTKQFDDFMEKADLHDLRRGALGDIDPKKIMTPLPPESADLKRPTEAPLIEGERLPPQSAEDMDDDEAYHFDPPAKAGIPLSPLVGEGRGEGKK